MTGWPFLFLDLIYAGVCERMTHRACFSLAAQSRTKSVLKSRACREEGLHRAVRDDPSPLPHSLVDFLYSVSKRASPPTTLCVKRVAKLNLS